MPPEDSPPLAIPTEVPWRLAGTTRKLQTRPLGPATNTISVFSYEPTLENANTNYPDDRIIYLKFAVSISPMFLTEAKPLKGDPLNIFSNDPMPIWRAVFDVRIAPEPFKAGGITPYFLSAAPLRRTVIQTGVVGQQLKEGESKGLAIGKSGSQMHESYSSTVDTDTSSGGGSIPLLASGSYSETSTSISGSRDVTQHVDTTQRNASTERQELVSHMTSVTNVLTLLSAFNVGSPYLRFSLWPEPLTPLTIDPSDHNLWYAELLRRRSSGIEGMQEFYAVAIVPRALSGFCLQAALRRFSAVLPPLPKGTPVVMPDIQLGPTPEQEALLVSYLNRRYPRGTPADDLDVELDYGTNQPARPTIDAWGNISGNQFMSAVIVDHKIPNNVTTAVYKTASEVWLDMTRAEYENQLVQSPLASGLLYFRKLSLTTCFDGASGARIRASSFRTLAPAMPQLLDATTSQPSIYLRGSERRIDLYKRSVFMWNAVEDQLGRIVQHANDALESERLLRFDDPRLIECALQHLAAMETHDPANVSLRETASGLALAAAEIASLEAMGIGSLRELARVILADQIISTVNEGRKVGEASSRKQHKAKAGIECDPRLSGHPRLRLLPTSVAPRIADRVRRAVGVSLQNSAERLWRLTQEEEEPEQLSPRLTISADRRRRSARRKGSKKPPVRPSK